ncbi:MAG: pyridoxamine 5'-phosphate oxidase family protein [Bacteroidales bacterium]|jgi:uncharacterized protein YhbP (UPF0306 family)|nr:pyridoxamine 5'-phosphate oxidase family protein [Bacteroidales bacterium]
MLPDPRIVKFLKKHHVLTVCTTIDDEPWCANCFYVYLEEENAFVFTTDHETRHGREFLLNSFVAGSVALETHIIGKIQGVQFQGTVTIAEGERLKFAEKAYLKRFPVAALMDTHLWIVDITLLKMTDNLLGFGKKMIWAVSGK